MFELHEGDCLDIIPTLKQGSVDFCFADLPYGITAAKWDLPIDPKAFWAVTSTVLSRRAVLTLTATLRFAAINLSVASIPFRYDIVWQKNRASGFLNSKNAPLRAHELVLVFADGKHTYNPQMRIETGVRRKYPALERGGETYGIQKSKSYDCGGRRYPTSVITPPYPDKERGLHGTQKPVALLRWLVATYTNASDTVLDPAMGSGSTGVACADLGRRFIGVEKDPVYFAAAKARIEKAYADAARPSEASAC